MNGKYTRILATSAGILLIVYLLYQTVFTSLSSIKTETAIAYTAEETISAEGYIIRDETIITSDDAKGGVLNYEIADGNRVAKGGKVAGVYKSERDVEIKAQIAELDNQISNLSVVCNMDMSNVTDLSRIDNQIKTGLIDLLDSVDGGDYSSLSAAADEYLTLLNKRLVAIGAETNFSARLATLQSRKAELEAQLGTAIDITSESAGYFVSSIDGYENVLGTDSVKTLTKEQLESIKPEETKAENVIGKTVDSVDWYIATVLSFEDSLKFTEGQALRIRVPLQTATELPVTVEKINRDAASSETVIVFKCGYMNGELSLIRTQPLTIIVSSSEGLYVPNDARRIVDNQMGVFVKTGNAVKFKPIEVIYNGTGFVICKKDGELRLYDEVIVKGNDLYDGKIVN
ncbi:MAG: HlyD family efflux transporter periplasmic adaptor subunit [Acutalibacteraceae bacterium]|nr:hypothetical protein [Clostridia bacterium]MBQ2387926.1 hypothetical protein [Clostridia bacterium]MEE1127852.1 HlyD family efflux transporter periplasmic adaptor subunit [Acutalibacteraceae bacterium]